ncbi:MAG: glycosyltransferase [Bacteroidota bacterium]
MKILYISYDGITDPLGQSQILPYILELKKKGHDFHIISAEKPESLQQEKIKFLKFFDERGIKWHPLSYHKKPPIVSTVYDMLSIYFSAKDIVCKERIQLVHCRSYLPGLVGLRLKKKMGVKFLFDMRGFWADERIDGGIWNPGNPIYKFIYSYFKRAEIKLLENADHVVSLTNSGKKEILSGNLTNTKLNIDSSMISIIPCAVDLDLFDKSKVSLEEKEKLINRIGLPRQVTDILVYLGSIGTWYLLDEMLMYFKKFRKEKPRSIFLFITKDDPDRINERVKEMDVSQKDIKIVSSNREMVPTYLSLGTQGVFFIKPAYSKKASSATKMAEMLAMGLPIITNIETGDINMMKSESVDEVAFDTINVVRIAPDSNNESLEDYKLSNAVLKYNEVYRKCISAK